QSFEAVLADEVVADAVLEILLPVQLHGTGDVTLVVCLGVLVDLDEHDVAVAEVFLDPVSGDERSVAAHGVTSCVPADGRVWVLCWVGWFNRRNARYISQPRHRPTAALSRAATSANAVSTSPTVVPPTTNAVSAPAVNSRPTSWAKRGGRASSVWSGAPIR